MAEQDKPLTPDELAAIRERVDAAASGPWEYEPGFCVVSSPASSQGGIAYDMRDADAYFIAAARTDIPRLLATLDAYRAIVEAVAICEAVQMPHGVKGDMALHYDTMDMLALRRRAIRTLLGKVEE
jgi:hypothetical protein